MYNEHYDLELTILRLKNMYQKALEENKNETALWYKKLYNDAVNKLNKIESEI